MAKAQSISPAAVQRIWSSHGLKPHLVKRFKLSTDPRFVEKLRDVVGLYLNPPENARLTFEHVVNDQLQEMIDANFKFYKQVNDDEDFAAHFIGWLFDRYYKKKTDGGGEAAQ